MHACLCVQELQTSSCRKHECTTKDARHPKFRSRNRYADVSPCKCLTFCPYLIRYVVIEIYRYVSRMRL